MTERILKFVILLYHHSMDNYNNIHNEIRSLKESFSDAVFRASRKKRRDEIERKLLCDYINPVTLRSCNSYKTKNSVFCHCHYKFFHSNTPQSDPPETVSLQQEQEDFEKIFLEEFDSF